MTADFGALFAATPGARLAVAVDRPRFTIVGATDDFLRASGSRRDALVGRGIEGVLAGAERRDAGFAAGVLVSIARVIDGGETDVAPARVWDVRGSSGDDGDGSERWWTVSTKAVVADIGSPRYLILSFADATELACVDGDLESLPDHAVEALLEPLNVIAGYAQLLVRGRTLDEPQRRALERIVLESDLLARMLGGLRDSPHVPAAHEGAEADVRT